jgi:formyl-CoA transferase
MSCRPLKKFRILDLTNVLSGPFCCHLLAHLGADIVKVEVPGSGDLARQLGADPDLSKKKMGVSFLAQNAGKKSLTLNLKSVEGKSIFKKLVETADVLVENFRPGVMDRLGLGFEVLKQINCSLIYCAISGFGSTGDLRDKPAYDQIIQGMSGVMSITGDCDSAPLRVGYPVADSIGGLSAALAVTSLLAGRNGELKEAAFVDVSMLAATMSTMGWVVSNYLIAGKEPQPMGNDNFTASPSGTFRTGEGLINIAANKQEQFEALCRVVGLEQLIEDERFYDRLARLENREVLKQLLEKALSGRSAREWEKDFSAASIPAGLVLTVPEALNNRQWDSNEMIGRFSDLPDIGDIAIFRPGFRVDGRPLEVADPPPKLGEHTEQILGELGFSHDDIQNLHSKGVI